MYRRFCNWLLYKRMGWTRDVTQPHPRKYIICLAPHTSNWDFFMGQLYNSAEGLTANFLMKKEWFFWPLGVLFRHLGGIPVHRQKHTSMTDTLAQTAISSPSFRLCITPEGTRSRVDEWKRGFYFIAQKAQLPILLYGLDYEQRKIVCTKTIIPSGDVDSDMREIRRYFKDFKGKHPENFSVGDIA